MPFPAYRSLRSRATSRSPAAPRTVSRLDLTRRKRRCRTAPRRRERYRRDTAAGGTKRRASVPASSRPGEGDLEQQRRPLQIALVARTSGCASPSAPIAEPSSSDAGAAPRMEAGERVARLDRERRVEVAAPVPTTSPLSSKMSATTGGCDQCDGLERADREDSRDASSSAGRSSHRTGTPGRSRRRPGRERPCRSLAACASSRPPDQVGAQRPELEGERVGDGDSTAIAWRRTLWLISSVKPAPQRGNAADGARGSGDASAPQSDASRAASRARGPRP